MKQYAWFMLNDGLVLWTSSQFWGYFAALFMGIALGLVGGGGSILTIPVLVYAFHISPVLATAYSLFIVGFTSLVGAVGYMRKGLLNYRTAFLFAIPSLFAVYLTRRYLMPHFPETLFSIGQYDFTGDIAFGLTLIIGVLAAALILLKKEFARNPDALRIAALMAPAAGMVFIMRQFVIPNLPPHLLETYGWVLTKDRFILLFFSTIMIMAAISMIKGPKTVDDHQDIKPKGLSLIVLEGLGVGTITGFVGAGGGFLIIPALVILARLPMKIAVGTSLLIITIKSLIGFLGDVQHFAMDWGFLWKFTAIAILGILGGMALSDRFSGNSLKKGFGYAVLILGIFMFIKEMMN